ncbi:MAG: NAD(P)H-binding protein [Pacificimonas sp.]
MPTTAQKLLLFGAGGETGREVLEQALAAGHHVRAVEHSWPDGPLPDRDGLERREADLITDDLSDLTEGVDAVISAVGLGRSPKTLIDPPPLYTEGAVRMVQAMRAHGVERLVVISAAFVDDDVDVPHWFRASAMLPLRNIFRQMAEMERVLRATESIRWTAARAGWLLDLPATGDYEVSGDGLPRGTLRTRHADLADFLLKTALGDDWVRQTPHVARAEESRYQTPPALIDELRP